MLNEKSMLIKRSIQPRGATVCLQCLSTGSCLWREASVRLLCFGLFARSIENIWRGPGSDVADHVELCFCWMMQASRVAKQVACPRRCQLCIARVEASSSFFVLLRQGVEVSNNVRALGEQLCDFRSTRELLASIVRSLLQHATLIC